MSLTLKQLMKTGRLCPQQNQEGGNLSIQPSLKLKCLNDGGHPHSAHNFFSRGEIVYADYFNQRDNAVHLAGIGHTWPIHLFKIQK